MPDMLEKGVYMVKLQSPGAFLTMLLEKHNLNPFKLSRDIHLSQSAVRLIALGETRISVPVAMRLAKYFGSNPESWLMMQMKWDIAEASKDGELAKIVKSISRFKKDTAAGKKPVSKKPASKKPAAKKPEGKKKTAVKAVKKTAAKKAKKPVKRGSSAVK